MADTLTDLTLQEISSGLQKGDFTSKEITVAFLGRIELLNDDLNAFITPTPEIALQQAEQADDLLAEGRKTGQTIVTPLLGVPIGIKDVLITKGVRTTCGSKILDNFVPVFQAESVSRLRAAGTVMLGKTNTDEFAMGSSTENSAYGTTKNPWDLERVPGGSSGGSAAAVAARMAPIALGTDTGGSVRQPGSFCGITGLKTTYGRVSRYGLIAYGSSLDTVGVLGRNVEDISVIFENMAGWDRKDATTLDVPVPQTDFNNVSLNGIKVGVPAEYFIEGMQTDVEKGVHEGIAQLKKLGAEIVEISLPHTEYAVPVYYIIAPAEASANLARFDGIRYGVRVPTDDMIDMFKETRGQGFGPEVKRRIMLGTYALSAGYYDAFYGQAQKVRKLIRQDFEQAFEQVDVIASPVAPTTAFKIGGHGDDPLSMYLEDVFTLPANLAGVPGLTFPCGFDPDGLPIGLQLMGNFFREDLLFRTGYAFQQETDYHLKKPGLIQ
ncbi:MAG: Asp-tRNA(Asn)/Glu-tRNA(Gln) amidotransferase subunit GatA [Anaerolineales bacterium]|nr:Asp-tRNA(Asn)/Glu-tRNA(Gln) amidotransferase subunit GatA [Anaerolineales bacterium]